MRTDASVRFVKLARSTAGPDGPENPRKLYLEFFRSLGDSVPGLVGWALLDGVNDPREIVLETFWTDKASMVAFYSPANRRFQDFVRSLQVHLDKGPDREDLRAVEWWRAGGSEPSA